jgi:predicted ATPase
VEAEVYFRKALAIARQQEAKSLAFRAAMSLSRLLYAQGKNKQARQLLVDVYSRFTAGFDTSDLRAAQALPPAFQLVFDPLIIDTRHHEGSRELR